MRNANYLCLFTSALVWGFSDLYAQPPNPGMDTNLIKPPSWVRDYLAEDPLVSKDVVTLDDIQKGLEDPQRRGTVIDRHFKRVQISKLDEKSAFLTKALKSEFPEVQRQAARQLATLGLLEMVVRDILVEFLESDNQGLRQAASIALEQIDYKEKDWTEAYWRALIEGLASDDPSVVRSSAARIESQAAAAVPSLMEALKSPVAQVQREAAKILSRTVGSRPTQLSTTESLVERKTSASRSDERSSEVIGMLDANGSGEKAAAPSPLPGGGAVAKSPVTAEPILSARSVDIEKANVVRVYFGTNREPIEAEQPPWSKILMYPVTAFILVIAVVMSWWRSNKFDRHGCIGLITSLLFLLGIAWTLSVFRSELIDRWRIGTGTRFGPRRDSAEQVHYGTCDVSIPPKHAPGEIETPQFGPEDESLHVVLKRTEELEEKAFFDEVQRVVAELPKDQRSCFVFIHGFNVTFENAAKRTAQIHYDLEFSGVPIFFSWPSRASIRHYFSDRNEIEFSRYVIKEFLLNVSQRLNADRIHVIAHSMGADATCRAIAELGERGKIFDQIILAAPDIDRDVFRLQLAPRMTQAANRTTMYCSKNDMALLASKTFNDGPRAGDSRNGVLVIKQIDTVDASGIDTALLGHSYYGDCLPILNDVKKMVVLDLAPKDRNLLAWPVDNELNYWTLGEEQLKTQKHPKPRAKKAKRIRMMQNSWSMTMSRDSKWLSWLVFVIL